MLDDEWIAIAIYAGVALIALAMILRRNRGGWRLF